MTMLKETGGKASVAACERLLRGYSSKHKAERVRPCVAPVPLTYEQILARNMRLPIEWQERLVVDLTKSLKRHGLNQSSEDGSLG